MVIAMKNEILNQIKRLPKTAPFDTLLSFKFLIGLILTITLSYIFLGNIEVGHQLSVKNSILILMIIISSTVAAIIIDELFKSIYDAVRIIKKKAIHWGK
jgi:flagellar motor component MotA